MQLDIKVHDNDLPDEIHLQDKKSKKVAKVLLEKDKIHVSIV